MKKFIPILLIITFLLGFSSCSSESASIGIIGGADGPTAIFVTGNFSWIYFALAGILLVGILVFLLIKWKR